MPKSKTNAVVFQPAAHRAMLRGIGQIVRALRCTLGPTAPNVVIDQALGGSKPPEVLNSGGVIARRIIQLADRDEDMGAMLARAMVYRQQEGYGDGTATAAVLFQTIIEEGIRYIVSGGNAMQLRSYLQQGLAIIHEELDRMKFPVEGKKQLAQVAESICQDPEMAKLLGEIFDTIGEYGQLEVRKLYTPGLEREYVEGMYWAGGVQSRYMIDDKIAMRTEMQNAAIFISDYEFKEAEELAPVLNAALSAGLKSLIIVTRSLSERAIGFLLANDDPEKLHVIAVKAPGTNPDDRMAALEDLSILTGGQSFLKVMGRTTDKVTPQSFGRARRAWASHQNFGLIGGKGNPRALRQHIMTLQARFKKTEDADVQEKLQKRIGKLMGGSATLWVGGATETEITARKALAERTADTLRAAVREGALPGGGAAMLKCSAVLEAAAAASSDTNERAAYRVLGRAMAEPARVIFTNAGYDAGTVLAEIAADTEGDGFDVLAGCVINTVRAGLLDVAAVQKAALDNAVMTAALVLTIDVLVHTKNPQIAQTPE